MPALRAVELKFGIVRSEIEMKCKGKIGLPLACIALTAAFCAARIQRAEPAANVMSGTVAAIGYPIGGNTKVNMVGTAASQTNGQAKMDAKKGRKQNRRVEIIVSGEVIGVQMSK